MKFAVAIEGIPGTTIRVDVTDEVQQFAAAIHTRNGNPAISLMISCEEEAIRYAYRVDPTQDDPALGHILYAGQMLPLLNGRTIREFRFINEVAQTNGVLQVTPGFEVGVD